MIVRLGYLKLFRLSIKTPTDTSIASSSTKSSNCLTLISLKKMLVWSFKPARRDKLKEFLLNNFLLYCVSNDLGYIFFNYLRLYKWIRKINFSLLSFQRLIFDIYLFNGQGYKIYKVVRFYSDWSRSRYGKRLRSAWF